jgi:hypothetical protein
MTGHWNTTAPIRWQINYPPAPKWPNNGWWYVTAPTLVHWHPWFNPRKDEYDDIPALRPEDV